MSDRLSVMQLSYQEVRGRRCRSRELRQRASPPIKKLDFAATFPDVTSPYYFGAVENKLESGAALMYGTHGMSKVEQIESAIAKLTSAEARQVAKWLQEFLADEWDRQIEADAKAGKLDGFIEEALDEDRQGKTTPLP